MLVCKSGLESNYTQVTAAQNPERQSRRTRDAVKDILFIMKTKQATFAWFSASNCKQ